MSSDPINPKHYKHLPVEAIDIIMAAIAEAPSNKSAYLQGQVLKYLLRCWSKKGVEDLRKAKWYLDRLVASFDETIAEASGVSETPSDDTEIPQGWRELEPDEFPSAGDKFAVDGKWVDLSSNWTVSYGCAPSRQVYIRKIEEPSALHKPSKTQPPSGYRLLGPAKDERRYAGDLYWSIGASDWLAIESHQVSYVNQHDWAACRKIIAPIETPSAPPKRYREPTQADLRDGAIECEYRDDDDEQWRSGLLVYILNGVMPFLCTDKEELLCGQWAQCRIEVAE